MGFGLKGLGAAMEGLTASPESSRAWLEGSKAAIHIGAQTRALAFEFGFSLKASILFCLAGI